MILLAILHCARPFRPIVSLVAIVLPLQGLQVAQFVAPAVGDRLDVIYLPAILGGLPVIPACHRRPARVLAVIQISRDRSPLLPDGLDGRWIEAPSVSVAVAMSAHCCTF